MKTLLYMLLKEIRRNKKPYKKNLQKKMTILILKLQGLELKNITYVLCTIIIKKNICKNRIQAPFKNITTYINIGCNNITIQH